MLDEGTKELVEAGLDEPAAGFECAADMRYVGQQNEIPVPLSGDPRNSANQSDLRERFNTIYQKLYGLRLDEMDVEVVSWRVTAHGGEAQRAVTVSLPGKEGAAKSHRPVYIENRHVDVPVYDRSALAAGQSIAGPVIVEERETTVFVLAGWQLVVHIDGSLIATRQE
jgi:N-methylhydantoinase A